MARSPVRLTRVRSIPWLLVLRTGQLIWAHLRDDLSPHDRRRLGALVRTPPHRLTAQERADLRAIVRKVDLAGLGKDLAGLRGLRR
ncbi:MAG: hypothetical protein QOG77_386 [Solirubrobacteraceae bacterium]|jgi:hypothetical protein|nr:hypothetical protein [Solirubrobacteraceae bacterium]